MLTPADVRRIFNYDPLTGEFTWAVKVSRKTVVGAKAGTRPKAKWYYPVVRVEGRNYYVHVVIWVFMTGAWPDRQVDHRDQVKLNTKWSNLRLATNKQNHENVGLQSNNTSGHRGVSWCAQTKRWLAGITHNGKAQNLGRFINKADAIAARRAAEDRLFTHHKS